MTIKDYKQATDKLNRVANACKLVRSKGVDSFGLKLAARLEFAIDHIEGRD